MNGATAELSVKTSNNPSKTKNNTIGSNHHFLRTFKNPQNSRTMYNLLIGFIPQSHLYREFRIAFHNHYF